MIVRLKQGKRIIVIGEIREQDHTFNKRVQASKHLFKKFDAWGIDAQYFTDVLLPREYDVVIIDTESNQKYRATAKQIQQHGQFFHFKDETKGEDYRAQIFLPRRYWQ